MSELFREQSLLTLGVPTDLVSLASASETKIRYRKPSGAQGEWNATVSVTDLIYNLSNGDIDEVGRWQFQAYAVVGSLKGFGKIKSRFFQNHI